MSDVEARLMKCFAAVFPATPEAQIPTSSIDTVPAWDSVAAATLFSTIEEEFGVEVDIDEMENLTSFQRVLQYLVAHQP